MTTPRTAPENESDVFEQRAKPTRSVGVALRQLNYLLNEGLAPAVWLVTAKAADLQIDDRLPTGNRQIAKMTPVPAVEGFRPGAALRTMGAYRFTADRKVHNLIA